VPGKPDGDGWVVGFGGLLALELGSGGPVPCCVEAEGKGAGRRSAVRTSSARSLVGVPALLRDDGDDCGGAEDVRGAAATEEISPDVGAAADDGASAGVRGEARWKSESRSDLARWAVPCCEFFAPPCCMVDEGKGAGETPAVRTAGAGSSLLSGVTVLFACSDTACRAPAEEWAATEELEGVLSAEGDDVFGAGTTVIGCGRCNASCKAWASCAGVCVCAACLSASICARASLSVAVAFACVGGVERLLLRRECG
jgi:hypothetical protein